MDFVDSGYGRNLEFSVEIIEDLYTIQFIYKLLP